MDKKILAIDTSTKACSVAICSFTVEDDKITAFNVLFQSVCNIKITHSQTAMPIIEDALKNSFIKIDDIDYFASSRGPGSFTGLRIGISIIKGLAMSFDENIKNVASVDTLLALAYNKFDFNGIIISCLDARNNKVFCSIYDNTFKKMEALEENLNIDITQLCEKLQKFEKNIIFV
ncbi:MAG: tRNA (adenosine(37)-N6)-threonylcarbamoyltransferase complex dimerization subunit type 1 TsaB, partial [Oscillospiraceae bacterium]